MFWYNDRHFWRELPLGYRLLAWYCRTRRNPQDGRIPGLFRLSRMLSHVRGRLGLTTEAIAPVADLKVALDLHDPRAAFVYTELSGILPEVRLLQQLLAPGDTFIDIGANHGSYSLLAARFVGPTGRVIAMEPQPRLARLIAKSFAENNFRHCEVINVALSEETGQTTLHIPSSNSGAASLFEGYMAHDVLRSIEVRCVRLDELASAWKLSGHTVVKMDIEGGEKQCLRGGERFFRHHQPDLIWEINPAASAAAGYSVADLIVMLRSYGYTRFGELDAFTRSGETTADLDLQRLRNVVALPDRSPRLRSAIAHS